MQVQASGNWPSPLTQQWQEKEEKWMRLERNSGERDTMNHTRP